MAQTTSLFSLNTFQDTAQLNTEQRGYYRALTQNNVSYKAFTLITVNRISAVVDSGTVMVNLPMLPCQSPVFYPKSFRYEDDFNYAWMGEIERLGDSTCDFGDMHLSVTDGAAQGYIHIGGTIYGIFDLSGGVQLLAELTEDAAHASGCFMTTAVEGDPIFPAPPTYEDPCTVDEIRILVLYTQESSKKISDVKAYAQAAIDDINNSMANSSVTTKARVKLAKVYVLPSSYPDILITSDSALSYLIADPLVTNYKLWNNSDIVVLLTSNYFANDAGNLGLAGTPNLNKDSAYAVLAVHAAINKHVFAHEVGHLFGGRHESTTKDYRQGYIFGGKLLPKNRFNTIMVRGGAGGIRIPHYSNPNKNYNNKSTGDAKKADVSRLLGDTYKNVAAFIPDGVTYPTLGYEIKDPEYCQQTGSATIDIICGTAPYTVTWETSSNGISWTTQTTYNANAAGKYTYYFPIPKPANPQSLKNWFVRATVKDAQFRVAKVSGISYYDCRPETGGGTMKRPESVAVDTATVGTIAVVPNPAGTQAAVQFILPIEDNVSIAAYNLQGQIVRRFSWASLEAGNHKQPIALQGLPAGIYLLRIQGAHTYLNATFTINQ